VNPAIHAPRYEHTQRAPLVWLLLAISIAFATAAILAPEPAVTVVHGFVALLVLGFAPCFAHLTVRDEGEDEGPESGSRDRRGVPVMNCTKCETEMVRGRVGKGDPLHLRFVPDDHRAFVRDYAPVIAYACPECGSIQLATDPASLAGTMNAGAAKPT